MTAEEWIDAFGPLTNGDEPIELDEISLTQAIQAGQPGPRLVLHPDRAQRQGGRRGRGVPPGHLRRRRLGRDDHVLASRGRRSADEDQGMGSQRLGARAGTGDEPLRRQHVLRAGDLPRRKPAHPRRRHRHPHPRPRAGGRISGGDHPHAPPPRPHPGPHVLPALLPLGRRDHDLGPVLAGDLAREPDRPLHLGAALAGRGPRASVLGRVPRGAGVGMEHRRHRDPRGGRHPPRSDPRLPHHGRRDHPLLHPGPRAGARSAAGEPGGRVDLGLRPGQGRRLPDPRLPVHGRRVPGARRLGPLRRWRTP